MAISLQFAAGLLLLLPLYWLVSSAIRERRFQAFARAHGCEEPYTDEGKLPWNVDRVYNMMKAKKHGKDALDDYFSPPVLAHNTLQRTKIGGDMMLETIDPENVKTMLATNFKDWVIGEARHDAFRPVLGKSIFTSDGPFWEHSRAMFRPQFARDLINDLEATEESVDTLFQAIGSADSEGWTQQRDMIAPIINFVLDNATKFLFGEMVGAQRAYIRGDSEPQDHVDADMAKLASGKEFADAFDTCGYWMVMRVRLQGLRRFGDSRKFRDAIKVVQQLPAWYVRRAVERHQAGTNEKKFDLLSNLIEHTQDKQELQDQVLSILVAGRDTTSALLVWTFLLLAQHPRIYQKLRSIVLERFPQPPGETLDFVQLKDCRYLQHVMQETLRLYQVVPLNSRVAVRDTVLPVGGGPGGSKPVAVREGQTVLCNIYAMHRRKDLWGEDALEYIPERWEDPSRSRMLGGGWLFTPFSGGPRICIGQQFALTEAAYCLVRAIQRYDAIELDPNSAAARHEHIPKNTSFTLLPQELKLRFHEASASA